MTVVLLTDFDDYYPASMKGVLERHGVEYTDGYHGVSRGDVHTAAFALKEYAREYPAGTVHCVVVDPGVGTDRAAVAVESGGQVFVGPDNGVLHPAATAAGDPTYYLVTDRDPEVATFHGRDVFAPVAARIAAGEPPSELGEETAEHEELAFHEARVVDGEAKAEVLYVDRFGNVVTTLSAEEMMDHVDFGDTIGVDGKELPLEPSYGHVAEGENLATVGSHRQLEIAVNDGSAAEEFDHSVGDTVHVDVTGSS